MTTTFDEACAALRPDLHRFCTRMTGSPCEGEDVVQEAMVTAFRRKDELREGASLRAWLFRIAHNRCIDLLRARRPHDPLDDDAFDEDAAMDDAIDRKRRVERALVAIAAELPPKERACVVLKDLLDWSLEETAEVTSSNVGAVKAALHRARAKIEAAGDRRPEPRLLPPRERAIVERYLEAFNRRDWDAVRALLTEDAQLDVVHRTKGPMRESRYFTNYSGLAWKWRLSLARVDGKEAVVHFREVDGRWKPHAVVQIEVAGDAVARVRDFVHVDYLLDGSEVVEVET